MAAFTNSTPPRVQYTANASQIDFAVSFPFISQSDLKVYQRGENETPDDTTQILILNVDYTVTGENTNAGGTVTLTQGAAQNDVITIIRDSDAGRLTDIVAGQPLSSDDLNLAFNHMVLLAQENSMAIVDLQLKYQNSAVTGKPTNALPTPIPGGVWRFNDAGTAIESVVLEECDDCSTLRSELAQNSVLSSGAELVGYYDAGGAGPTTVKAQLDAIGSPVLPVPDTTAVVRNSIDTSKLAGIDAFKVPTSSRVNVTWPDSNLDLGNLRDEVNSSLIATEGYITGLEVQTDFSNPDYSGQVVPGACRAKNTSSIIQLNSTLTKTINAAWSPGNAGGLPSSLTLSMDTTYFFFIIRNSSTGDVDAGWDTDINCTNLLADSTYDEYRRITVFWTDVSSPVFAQARKAIGGYVTYATYQEHFNTAFPAADNVATLLNYPQGVDLWISYIAQNLKGVTSSFAILPDTTISSVPNYAFDMIQQGVLTGNVFVPGSTQTIRVNSGATNPHVAFFSTGWWDARQS